MPVDDASAALSKIRYTLLILGTNGEKGPHFMIGNWGMQASFDPWRFVMMLKKTSHTLVNARKHGAFTVNLLGEDKAALAKALLKKGHDDQKVEKGALAAPRLAEAYAGFDCQVLQIMDIGGDHALVVADVVDGWSRGEGPALTLPELALSYAG